MKAVFSIFCFFVFFAHAECFDKVVIWGHKLHSHTHSYIHASFHKAFVSLGYLTYWFDDQDDLNGVDFSNALFITEGQADGKIPIREDCKYILHNCARDKYENLKDKNYIFLQVYTDDVLDRPGLIRVGPCIYYDLKGRCVYMPWATDLLPSEIEQQKRILSLVASEKKVVWVGTIGDGEFGNVDQINPFIKACEENGCAFFHKIFLSFDENKNAVASSYMAPAIVGKWQEQKGYIPCRIFKNVSYGKMGITNSRRVYELFEHKIVYNPDIYQLFYDAKDRVESMKQAQQFELMDFVKNKHTYINRIHTLLDFLTLIENAM